MNGNVPLNLENSYSTEESSAIARLIWVLIFSDEIVDPHEVLFFDQALKMLGITQESFKESLSVPMESVYEVIRRMPARKRRECGTLLRLTVTSDGLVDLAELSKLNSILEKAAVFRPDNPHLKKMEGGF